MEVKDKIAVVTGAAGGLGSATARVLHEAGAKIAIVDYNEEGAQAVAAELGGDTRAYKVDITDSDNVQEVINQIATDFGTIHVICNIAGGATGGGKLFGKKGVHDAQVFADTLALNAVGTFNMMAYTAEVMSGNEPVTESGERGVMINTASVAGVEGQMGQVAYAAGKAAIIGMTITAARDLSSIGIRVNTIVPGIIDTDMMLSAPENVKDHLLKAVEFPKRFGKPEEVGKLILFLVGNEYINGECIRLDGGLRAPAR